MRARHVIAFLALGVTPALAACGGSSPHDATKTAAQQPSGQITAPSSPLDQMAPPARTTAAKATATAKASSGAYKGPKVATRPDPVSSTRHAAKARHRAKNEQRGTGVKPLDPCTLVTRAEAGKIVGRPIVALHQASQGPTCVYQARETKSLITMAVQLAPFNPKKQRAQDVTRVTLRGHKAYCVKGHDLAMFVPLATGYVLNVTAPCPIAAGFASKALARLYP